MRPWETLYSEADRALLKKIGMGQGQAFGRKPAFLIVDVAEAFVGACPKPLAESTDESALSCGEAAWEAMGHIRRLQEACRARNVPVIFTTNASELFVFTGGPTKADRGGDDRGGMAIADPVKALPGELIIRKTKASGFFETPLLSALHRMGIDCLLIGGTSTSGCVRATVVDAWSHGFRCFVVEECTFDRFSLSHGVNLWDMNAKYADVIGVGEALTLVTSLA